MMKMRRIVIRLAITGILSCTWICCNLTTVKGACSLLDIGTCNNQCWAARVWLFSNATATSYTSKDFGSGVTVVIVSKGGGVAGCTLKTNKGGGTPDTTTLENLVYTPYSSYTKADCPNSGLTTGSIGGKAGTPTPMVVATKCIVKSS
jgi:hypothetical protein